MSFNKRILSEKVIKMRANENDYESFYNYFKSDALILEDKFSEDIWFKIKNCTIKDKDLIIEIMNECKI